MADSVFADFHQRNTYHVTVDPYTITATVTSDQHVISTWIAKALMMPQRLVGLTTKRVRAMDLGTKVAVLVICVEETCLLIQFCPNLVVPQSLHDFLGNPDYTFVGLGIDTDVNGLETGFGLTPARTKRLEDHLVDRLGDQAGLITNLRELAKAVVGVIVEMPRKLLGCKWDYPTLDEKRIKHAAIDAFFSYKIGSEWGLHEN